MINMTLSIVVEAMMRGSEREPGRKDKFRALIMVGIVGRFSAKHCLGNWLQNAKPNVPGVVRVCPYPDFISSTGPAIFFRVVIPPRVSSTCISPNRRARFATQLLVAFHRGGRCAGEFALGFFLGIHRGHRPVLVA